jgi:hypothetical protein
MILISHRGNINGRIPDLENSPDYIDAAIKLGYDVEVDVWFYNDSFFLGHDNPTYKIEESFLENKNFWCHAKNLDSLVRMLKNPKIHSFWHQEDDYTVTSKGIIWTYPGKPLTLNSICVLPKWVEGQKINCLGICSDFIEKYK